MKRYILFLITALTLVSCTEFLDIKPYGKEIPKTAEDFSALIHNLCNDLDYGDGKFSYIYSCERSSYFEEVADNNEVNLTEQPGGGSLSSYIGDNLSSEQGNYKSFYEIIGICNMTLDAFPNGGTTQEEKDVIGTAYAFRGWCYYNLLQQFCAPPLAADGTLGVPLVTTFDMEERPIRSSMQETISQVESDFQAAIACHIQEPMYRFNDDVCKGFLARLYHWCGRWSEARALAQELLTRYPLITGTDYTTMMTTQFNLVGNTIFKANVFYDSSNPIAPHYTTWNYRPLSTRFVELFTEGSNDVRTAMTFNAKRKNQKLLFASLRSAELALIAMECAYHLGDQNTALQELNDFRRLRISPYTDLTMTTLPAIRTDEYIKEDCYGNPLTPLLYAILVERRKELYFENGDRWFELKRNGRPEWWIMNKGLKYWTRKYMYTFPLPIQDIRLQPDLIQNPGYDEATK